MHLLDTMSNSKYFVICSLLFFTTGLVVSPPTIVQTYTGGYQNICIIVTSGCLLIFPGEVYVRNFTENRSNGYLWGNLALVDIFSDMTVQFEVLESWQVAFENVIEVVVHGELLYRTHVLFPQIHME